MKPGYCEFLLSGFLLARSTFEDASADRPHGDLVLVH